MPILEQVRYEIQKRSMLAKGDRVIAAVSGGPDSVALVHLLYRLAPEWELSLHLFHLDHGLRGTDSAADAAYVAGLAAQWELPFTLVTLPSGELKEAPGSLQSNARRRRYAELRMLASQIGATRIATGHNQDDQAETVLMRLVRGAGPRGLAGIPPVRSDHGWVIIRPLLFTSRRAIENYCHEHKLNPRLDASNLESHYLRNRIRLELLPLLTREYNPTLNQSLSQVAELLHEEDEFLEHLAQQAFERCCLSMADEAGRPTVTLSGVTLASEPVALARRVVREAARKVLGPEVNLGYEAVNQACDLAVRLDGTHQLDLSHGLRLTVAYGRCRFDRPPQAGKRVGKASTQVWVLAPQGVTPLPELGAMLVVEECMGADMVFDLPPDEIWLDQDLLPGPLAVRVRLPGDRIWPQGMEGSKKLQDILVDAKVPQGQRDQLPLLVAGDALLWIPGIRRDRRYLAGPRTERALRVLFKWAPEIVQP